MSKGSTKIIIELDILLGYMSFDRGSMGLRKHKYESIS